MELMSPLLCMLLVLFARGTSNPQKKETKTENPNIFEHKSSIKQKHKPLNVSKLSQLQSLLTDVSCKDCVDCIETTINAQSNQYAYNILKSYDEELNNGAVGHHELNAFKDKRHAAARRSSIFKTKKYKSKKHKNPKSVSVIKYTVDDEVYALKVNEIKTRIAGEFNDSTLTTSVCQVYQVKKSVSCNTPESEVLLAAAKKKASKRKDKNKFVRTTYGVMPTENPIGMMPGLSYLLKKRELDPLDLESVMPSIEDSFGY